jgi:hypothetical protein
MDLNDFGKENRPGSSRTDRNGMYDADDYISNYSSRPVQWKIAQSGVFEICGSTTRQLPAGAYGVVVNQYGDIQFHARDLQVDDLIDFSDSLPAKILLEIENFWTLGDTFRTHGYLHRRGYLL